MAALRYLHAHRIAHRDLKLENVLVERRTGCAKLCDFGFAVELHSKEEFVNEFSGTRAYSSPEVLLMRPHSPFAADIWSFGVCSIQIPNTHSYYRPNEKFGV